MVRYFISLKSPYPIKSAKDMTMLKIYQNLLTIQFAKKLSNIYNAGNIYEVKAENKGLHIGILAWSDKFD